MTCWNVFAVAFAQLSGAGDVLPVFLAVVLGGAAVYLLLPRARPYPPLLGAAVAGLALLAAGALVIRAGVASTETILFYVFAGLAVLSGGLLVTQQSPVRAALSFALVILSTCGLFLLQAATFLMAATIIVYAGAVIVTFLFVVMLAQQSGLSNADVRSREPLFSSIAGFVLLGALLFVLQWTYDTRSLDGLIRRTEQMKSASTPAEMRAALGDEDQFFQAYYREMERFGPGTESSRALGEALTAFQRQLSLPQPHPQELRLALDHLEKQAYGLRGLPPPAGVPMSAHSGVPSNRVVAVPRDARGNLPMPAENVARLGRSLFTDFLLAVELGGTLLLVATVGAIAIAGRRGEVLR